MRVVYTQYEGGVGVGWTPQALDAWQRAAPENHTHTQMHNTCWPDTCSRGMAQHIHGAHTTQRVHMGTQREGGGRGQREGVGVRAQDTPISTHGYTLIFTQGTAHSAAPQMGGIPW